jgi:hypothetical protein
LAYFGDSALNCFDSESERGALVKCAVTEIYEDGLSRGSLQMRALLAIIALGAGTALADDKPGTDVELLERGAVEITNGLLFKEAVIHCMPFLHDPGCSEARPVYGYFRRLKLKETEFVCISFRGWACFETK